RRHTRSKRDWSSDVCSSDLYSLSSLFLSTIYAFLFLQTHLHLLLFYVFLMFLQMEGQNKRLKYYLEILPIIFQIIYYNALNIVRSEERRVGKECRSRR